ncbi:hypothetical protein F4781DRAFT_425195 [Annulohypoxylon bovei var. microspora]|nr:hypothetical protein F4781DRAFT_425195 [Annulohypoxylon bovei var. microspora]
MNTPSAPFTTRVLEPRREPGETSRTADFAALLPASHRTRDDQIVVPEPGPEFLKRELLVRRLNDVQDWLWVCGRPMPPRPLRYALAGEPVGNHQALISRDVTVTEDPELHLVWSKNRIFLKPVPLYLLDPDFWEAHVLPDKELACCARGFLFSYAALVAYESDFVLALEKRLLPGRITWAQWKALAGEILESHDFASVNPRYWYGELRLSRLNKVYRVRKGFVLRGYSKVASHAVYGDLISDNFGALATILGYVVIVLTAMQVGLGVDRLQSDEAFQNASYGFTVFSIIAPLVASVGIALAVLVMFVSNWAATKSYEGKRFRKMGVEPFWREPGTKAAFSSVEKRLIYGR